MTEAQVAALARKHWPADEIIQVAPLRGTEGDWMVYLRRPRRAVHIINAQGKPVCHEECMK